MELVRRSRRPVKLLSCIDASAFAGIMIVLVFTVWLFQEFSYTSHHGVSADLPQVWHAVPMPGAARDDAMRVTILRDGQVYFGIDRIWADDLAQKIRDRLKDREVERKVYITADVRARWATVKVVAEQVRSAGILRVGFLAGQRRLPQLTH
jgi:biopolymer transport protein ExbD